MKDLIHWLLSVDWLNFAGVFATVIALGLSLHFWRRQFRPIITAMVETHHVRIDPGKEYQAFHQRSDSA
ncbi:hypothetical protein [Mesorhizobium caraganae]|uniref:hypothetical protein n=1 Tax=Mesorhizobium caraganae TaxID=483206 RepID=UPI0017846E31|nr:hypothetical protein [Mesorhizobium caraganae]